MALVTDAQCSAVADYIVKHVSQLECVSELDGKMKIHEYLQMLSEKYNNVVAEMFEASRESRG